MDSLRRASFLVELLTRGRSETRPQELLSLDEGRIPIFSENKDDDEVDRDALVAKVVSSFTAIKTEDVEAIARISGGE
jgi:hypothetical protein